MLQKKLNKLQNLKNNKNFENLNSKTQHKIMHQIRCIEFQIRLKASKSIVYEMEDSPFITIEEEDDDGEDEILYDLYNVEEHGVLSIMPKM